jgi:hypothetical protein
MDMLWRTLGHGDAFVFEIQQELDQHYYQDDEIVVASERPIQTVFNVP